MAELAIKAGVRNGQPINFAPASHLSKSEDPAISEDRARLFNEIQTAGSIYSNESGRYGAWEAFPAEEPEHRPRPSGAVEAAGKVRSLSGHPVVAMVPRLRLVRCWGWVLRLEACCDAR